jgi:DNA-directed RNA polymerase specialized sigma24 family protein
LRKVAEGDLAAWAALWGGIGRRVHAFIARRRRRGVDDPVTEELALEVMDRVWTKASTFQGDSKVATWVLGIARNVVLESLRESGRQVPLPEDREVAPPSLEDFPIAPDQFEALLDDLMSGLSEPKRRALSREIEFGSREQAREGMTSEEAATHRQNVSRARKDIVARVNEEPKFVPLRSWLT